MVLDPVVKWLNKHNLSSAQHLPVLRALGVNRLADLASLRGLVLPDLFSSIEWSLSFSWLPTALPCAPRCTAVKGALYKAINAEHDGAQGGHQKSRDEL